MEGTSRRATVPAGNGARQAGQGEKVKKMTKSFPSLGNEKTLKFFRPAPMERTSRRATELAEKQVRWPCHGYDVETRAQRGADSAIGDFRSAFCRILELDPPLAA